MLISRYSANWFYIIFKLFQQKKMPDFQYAKLLFLLVYTNTSLYKLSFLNYGVFFCFIKNTRGYILRLRLLVLVRFYFINFFYKSLYFFKIQKFKYISKKCHFSLTMKLRNRYEKFSFIFVYLLNLFNIFKIQIIKEALAFKRYFYKIQHLFAKTLCFNIIIRKNTAFLQCVHPQHNIIFTATSTQFGFLKFKRYARFIFDFFFLLSFSLFFELPFLKIGFNLILNPFFRFSGIIKHFFRNAYFLHRSFFCKYLSTFDLLTVLDAEAVSFQEKILIQSRWLSGLCFNWFIYYKAYFSFSIRDLISVFFVFYSVFWGFRNFRAFDIRTICNAFCHFFNFGYIGTSLLIFFFDFRLYCCWADDYISYFWGNFLVLKSITAAFLKFTVNFIYKVVAQISLYFKKRFLRFWAIFCKFFYDHLLLFLLLRCGLVVLLALLAFLLQPRYWYCSLFALLLPNNIKPEALSSYISLLFFVFFYRFALLRVFVIKKKKINIKTYKIFRHPTFLPEWLGAIRDFQIDKRKKNKYIRSSWGKAVAAEELMTLPFFKVNNKIAYSGCRLAKNRRKKVRSYPRSGIRIAGDFFKNYII